MSLLGRVSDITNDGLLYPLRDSSPGLSAPFLSPLLLLSSPKDQSSSLGEERSPISSVGQAESMSLRDAALHTGVANIEMQAYVSIERARQLQQAG